MFVGGSLTLVEIENAIELLATLAGILVIAYSGLMLIATKDPVLRSQWKDVILAVAIGLSVIYLAPLLGSFLSGGHYCG